MMLAPSSAKRTAWERPWPRAAPVMKATLPSNVVPMLVSLSFLAGLSRVGSGHWDVSATESGDEVCRCCVVVDFTEHQVVDAVPGATIPLPQGDTGPRSS